MSEPPHSHPGPAGHEPAAPRPHPGSPRRLLFAGEAIVDVVMCVPALPERGGDVLAPSAAITVGGGFNVMAAAARQGLPVLYAGGHGTGPWGDLVRAALEAEAVAVLRPPDASRDTGFDVALVEPDGERTFVTHLGAEALREPETWHAVPVCPGDAVYVSGYGLVAPESGPILAAWAAALPPGPLLFMDPGPLVAEIPATVLDPVLARCDWLSCNEREAALLTGASDPAEAASHSHTGPGVAPASDLNTGPDVAAVASHLNTGPAAVAPASDLNTGPDVAAVARRLLARTPRGNVIVRSGPAGCVLARHPESGPRTAPFGPAGAVPPVVTHIPAPSVVAVDSTGAGDAHAGVFLAALADGLDPAEAARRANAAAALAVTRPGPATAPTSTELAAWLTLGSRRT